MNWIQTATGRNLLLIGAALALPLAAAVGVSLAGVSLGRTLRMAIMLATVVPAFWLVGRYWRGLDEAAQEAQKTAWFWGGSFGMAAGLLVLVLLPLDIAARFPGLSPRALMMYGAVIPPIGAVVGFHAAWAWWWWARR